MCASQWNRSQDWARVVVVTGGGVLSIGWARASHSSSVVRCIGVVSVAPPEAGSILSLVDLISIKGWQTRHTHPPAKAAAGPEPGHEKAAGRRREMDGYAARDVRPGAREMLAAGEQRRIEQNGVASPADISIMVRVDPPGSLGGPFGV